MIDIEGATPSLLVITTGITLFDVEAVSRANISYRARIFLGGVYNIVRISNTGVRSNSKQLRIELIRVNRAREEDIIVGITPNPLVRTIYSITIL